MADNRFKDFPYDARFPSPGVDVRFDTPGLDRRFMNGQDTRFEGSDYGGIPVIGGVPSFAGADFTRGTVQTWGGFDFGLTRSSTGTVLDAEGNVISVAANTPRLTYAGGGTALLTEAGRTRINSDTVATQGVTVTAQAYAFTFYGTGSVVLSGAHSATLAGTGANGRVTLTFTPTAGTLTLTPTGDVRMWQVEAGTSATSYIATAGANVTRSPDLSNSALSAAIQTAMASGYWVFVQGAVMGGANPTGFDRVVQSDTGSLTNYQAIVRRGAGGTFGSFQITGGAAIASINGPSTPVSTRQNLAMRYGADPYTIWHNGTQNAGASGAYATPTVLRIAAADVSGSGKPASLLIEKIYFGTPSISVTDAAAHRSLMP